jgi:hypothetical protein
MKAITVAYEQNQKGGMEKHVRLQMRLPQMRHKLGTSAFLLLLFLVVKPVCELLVAVEIVCYKLGHLAYKTTKH